MLENQELMAFKNAVLTRVEEEKGSEIPIPGYLLAS